ncbi:unnamed protein product, partial [Ixodes pacificus]
TVITWGWSGSTARCGPSDRGPALRAPVGTASWTAARRAATAPTRGRTWSAVRSATGPASVSIRRHPSSSPMESAGSTSARSASVCLARWTAGAWSAPTWPAATPCSAPATAARTARTTPATLGRTGRGRLGAAPTWGGSTRPERGYPSRRTLAQAASARTGSSAACTLQIALAMLALWQHKALFTTGSPSLNRARESVPQGMPPGSRSDASPNRRSLEERQQPQQRRQRRRHPA